MLSLSPPKGGLNINFSVFRNKIQFQSNKSAAKFRSVKTSSGKVVEQSVSYEITEKHRTKSVSFHLKFFRRRHGTQQPHGLFALAKRLHNLSITE